MNAPAPPHAQRQLHLTPLTLADLDTVWEMEKRAYTHPWSRVNFQDSLQSGHPAQLLTTPLLAGDPAHPLTTRGHVLLGYWVAMQVLDEVHLLNIAVAPEHRRQGWGRVLLQSLATMALNQQAQWLWLEVRAGNTPARGLYQGFGFVPMGLRKQYYPAGHGLREDAVVMSLNLRATSADTGPVPAAPNPTPAP